MHQISSGKKTAVLAGVQLPGVSDTDHHGSLAELKRLVQTLGFEVVGEVSQKRKSPSPASLVGEGKLKELAAYTGGTGIVERFTAEGKETEHRFEEDEGHEEDADDSEENDDDSDEVPHADLVIFDSEVSPTQLRNLEGALGCEILDRTGVILEIFSRHARSKEARLQVEIAKLGYMAPRIRMSGVGADRQGGGIGAKGAGETAHELDKRRIRDRISELRAQLKDIHAEQSNRRSRRNEAPCVALVGYTNAGKSSLMRALTGSEVLVADKLFATLDTTVRAMQPEGVPRVLISDTVGFIKKLPHDLVASFRSTLDEALNASLLLFTVDASDPTFRAQLEVTKEALSEIGAEEIPSKLVLNKIDRLDPQALKFLKREFPDGVFLSALDPSDVKQMKRTILDFFSQGMQEATILIPYTKSKLIGEIHADTRVLSETHSDEGTSFRIMASPEVLNRLKKSLAKE